MNKGEDFNLWLLCVDICLRTHIYVPTHISCTHICKRKERGKKEKNNVEKKCSVVLGCGLGSDVSSRAVGCQGRVTADRRPQAQLRLTDYMLGGPDCRCTTGWGKSQPLTSSGHVDL